MTINWGILGAAKFAREHMAPAIHAASGARLKALATSDPEKAAPFRAFCPDLEVESSYESLLGNPNIDAVYIPLPNHLHIDWTLRALDAGKHVLCEKPIAMKADQIDQVIAARDRAGLLAAEAFMIVHHPQWQWVRDAVSGGEIGPLIHVSGGFAYDNRTDMGNIRNRPETGGGALPDIGVYIIGSTRFVTGAEPESVSARIRWENDVDVFADVSASFPGFTYSAYVSMRMLPWQEMVFHGEKGLIRLTAPFNANVYNMSRVELHRPGLEMRELRWPTDNHYVHQVEAFGRTLESGTAYPCPLEFVQGTQAVIDQAYANAVSVT